MEGQANQGRLASVTSTVTEIVFEVSEDEMDGGYSASAIGYGIHTQGEAIEEIRENVQEAFECHFDGDVARPEVIRLHC